MSDTRLARRLRDGDEQAFEEFFAEYFPRLYRFAVSRMRGNDDDAEEVVQAVLIRALDKIGTYRGEAALFTWLCTFCRREIAQRHDRVGRRAEVPLLETTGALRAALESLAAAADSPEVAYARQELSELVRLTLEHLPARYAEALQLKYIEELSVNELARRMDVGAKAAESLLSRARRAFREGFEDAAREVSERLTGNPPECAW